MEDPIIAVSRTIGSEAKVTVSGYRPSGSGAAIFSAVPCRSTST